MVYLPTDFWNLARIRNVPSMAGDGQSTKRYPKEVVPRVRGTCGVRHDGDTMTAQEPWGCDVYYTDSEDQVDCCLQIQVLVRDTGTRYAYDLSSQPYATRTQCKHSTRGKVRFHTPQELSQLYRMLQVSFVDSTVTCNRTLPSWCHWRNLEKN